MKVENKITGRSERVSPSECFGGFTELTAVQLFCLLCDAHWKVTSSGQN